jgi:predicted nucleotidyltransferase
MEKSKITVPKDKIQEFCNRWKVTEFSLFGSAIRDDFLPESDVDVLVSFSSDADWSLLDLIQMQDELREIFGREVDLVEEAGIRNPFRRHAILSSRKVVYAD